MPVLSAILVAELALACVAPAQNALANDTLAVLAAGGLQFAKTGELRMEAERLILSHDAFPARRLAKPPRDYWELTGRADTQKDFPLGVLASHSS